MKTEQDMAKIVVQKLIDEQWDIYQEVSCSNGIADIVGIKDNLIMVVECKKTFGLDVMAQAHHWIRYAHYVYIAVSARRSFRKSKGRWYGELICRKNGIGLFEVKYNGLFESIRPKLNRHICDKLKKTIRPEHKTFAQAGSADGGHYTPFKGLVSDLERFVKCNSGCSFEEAIERIDYHYDAYATHASAKQSIAKHIKEGMIDTIRCDGVGKRKKLYYIGK